MTKQTVFKVANEVRRPYAASKPLNGTQRKLRAQMPKESAVITNHVTMQFGNTMTECVANVPLRPGADHRNMPLALRQMQRTTCPSNKNAAKNRHYAGRIGRLDIDGAFNTCMTSMNLLGMNGKVFKISLLL
jgi:DNA (cytosine-5)-methyltransferase 1